MDIDDTSPTKPIEADAAPAKQTKVDPAKADQAGIPNGDNAVMARFDDSLLAIQKIIFEAYQARDLSTERTRQALLAIYELGCALTEEAKSTPDIWKRFYISHGQRWDKRAEDNPYHRLVTAAFGDDQREDVLSKYRAILKYATLRSFTNKQLEVLLGKGIDKAYGTAIKFGKRDLEKPYRETDDEWFDRAREQIKDRKLGDTIKLPVGSAPKTTVRSYTTALVRWNAGTVEFVDFLANQSTKDIETAVSKLVGPEGARVRKKLKAKSLYWFYSIVDVFERFVLDKQRGSEIMLAHRASKSNLKANLDQVDDPNSSEGHDAIRKAIKRSKNKPEPQTALQTSADGNGWIAQTISSYPAFPIVQAKFDKQTIIKAFEAEQFNGFDPTHSLLLTTGRARSFQTSFLEFNKWSVQQDNQQFELVSANEEAIHFPLDRLGDWQHKNHPWRAFTGKFSQRHPFQSEAVDLFDLLQWKDNHKAKKLFGRNIPFPRTLNIIKDDIQLWLQFERHTDQRQRLAKLNEPNEAIEHKKDIHVGRIAYTDIVNLAQVSEDYRLTFTGQFLEDQRGIVAIQFKANEFHCDLTITFPLIMTNQGDTAEISQLI